MIQKKAVEPPKALLREYEYLRAEWYKSVADIADDEDVPPDRSVDLYITTHCSDALLPYVGGKRPKGWKRPK